MVLQDKVIRRATGLKDLEQENRGGSSEPH